MVDVCGFWTEVKGDIDENTIGEVKELMQMKLEEDMRKDSLEPSNYDITFLEHGMPNHLAIKALRKR